MTVHTPALRRFGKSQSTNAMVLALEHPAVVEGRPLFKRSANEHKRATARVLVSGHNSRKIGKYVTKGAWKSWPIFTLTLEERATCPSSCELWQGCYGNRMPWSIRHAAGTVTEQRIAQELAELQQRYPGGFAVRLHVLGDFYSVAYVDMWRGWLQAFPALHVFGFTARTADEAIGVAIARLAGVHWDRFAIRSSGGKLPLPSAYVGAHEGISCPAETGASECCGTCALCWAAPDKTIVFHEH
jgi:hypothetical protein